MVAKFTRKDFLEALFSHYYKEHRGFILVKSVRRGDPKMSTRYFPNIDILAKEQYGEDRDVYFGICPRERMKAEKEHIRYLAALWADLDIGAEGHDEKKVYFEGPQQAAKAIRSFPRAPSIIVESGRGAHLYWLLKNVTEVTDPEKIEKLLRSISEHLHCDTDVSLDTVLRLPDTVNTKIPAKPVNCDVKFINGNFRYTLQEFENLGQRIVPPAPTRTAPQPPVGPAASAPPPPPPPMGGFSVPPPPPSFAPDPVEHRYTPGMGATAQNLDDSLVLDETIIDELIDDISMTGSLVTDGPESEVDMYGPPPPPLPPAAPPRPQFQPAQPEPPAPSDILEAPTGSPPSLDGGTPIPAGYRPVASTTGPMLERLTTSQTEVEITLLGSDVVITGVLAWTENGLIGIETGEDLYTIPLSSVSYIRSRLI